jgi:hypothetical protein
VEVLKKYRHVEIKESNIYPFRSPQKKLTCIYLSMIYILTEEDKHERFGNKYFSQLIRCILESG